MGIDESADETKRFRDEAFETLLSKLSDLPFLQVVRSCNAEIEYLDRFYRQFQWTNIIEDIQLETDRFFSAWLLLQVHEDSIFHTLISYLPQSALRWFRLTRPCIYVPHRELSHRSHRDDDGDEGLYEISFSVHPYTIGEQNDWEKSAQRLFRENRGRDRCVCCRTWSTLDRIGGRWG